MAYWREFSLFGVAGREWRGSMSVVGESERESFRYDFKRLGTGDNSSLTALLVGR